MTEVLSIWQKPVYLIVTSFTYEQTPADDAGTNLDWVNLQQELQEWARQPPVECKCPDQIFRGMKVSRRVVSDFGEPDLPWLEENPTSSNRKEKYDYSRTSPSMSNTCRPRSIVGRLRRRLGSSNYRYQFWRVLPRHSRSSCAR